MSFEQLGLSPEIMRAIVDQGYTEPTPIQKQAIPSILEGKDIMGSAQTGTGKTAGFTLPMLRRLQFHANKSVSPARHPIRALILVPTRELAAQVYESVKTYGKYLPLRSAVVYGGVNIDPQIKEIRAGVEILVATPGRLLDHLQQKTLSLSKVEILILDEADRMLDMGFLPDIKRILMLIPARRQSLMFSATFSGEIKKLADNLLNKPVLVEVARSNKISDLITHVVYPVSKARKGELVVHLLKLKDLKQVLVFARTKQGASQLARHLQREGITATEIHGDKNQMQRTQALNDFKEGTAQVLVATDVAARGLDIEDLPHVINFELPNTPEDYVHRIGRTGRAGAKGDAISLMCDEEKTLLKDIEKLIKTKLLVEKIEGFGTGADRASSSSGRQQHEKKDDVHAQQARKRSNEPKPKFNVERRSVPRTNRSSYGGSRRHNRPIDPIFTQPYVPTVDSIDEASNSTSASKAAYGRHKKPLAALLMPQVVNKESQEG